MTYLTIPPDWPKNLMVLGRPNAAKATVRLYRVQVVKRIRAFNEVLPAGRKRRTVYSLLNAEAVGSMAVPYTTRPS